MADLKVLSKRLIEVRKNNGYTRKRLAEELNRPYRTITNYETGEHEPGHKYLIEIAEKFGVTADYLLGLSDDPRKTSDEIEKSPSADEATLGEDVMEMFKYLQSSLVSAGLLKEGQDLTSRQADVLVAVCQIIRATFND